MSLALKPRGQHSPEVAAPQATYSDNEQAIIRRAFRLHPEADVAPWCAYARAMAVWRQRAAAWLACMLASPDRYLALTVPKSSRPAELATAFAEVRDYLLSLTPDRQPLELASDLMQPGNRSLLIELANAGWLPARPGSPATYRAERRTGISDEQRMREADERAEAIG